MRLRPRGRGRDADAFHQTPADPAGAGPLTRFSCRLADGVRLERRGQRRLLVRQQPLALLELSEPGMQLLERVREARTVIPDRAGLRLLRRLEELGLVELRPLPDAWPSVTVVVPARGRPRALARCLASLEAQTYPPELMQIVVVDDASEPPLAVPPDIGLVRLPLRRGPGGARNAGAAAVRTEVVAYIDSDCEAEPDWLRELVSELADPSVAAVGGRVLGAGRSGWLERYEAVRSSLDLGPRRATVRPRAPVPYLVGANLALRRSVLRAAQGFDQRLRTGEDVDLSWRLAASGHRLLYHPGAVVRHHHRARLADFVATRVRYAASEAALLRRHPANGRWLGLSPGLAAALLSPLGLACLAVEQTAAARRLGQKTDLPTGAALEALLRGQAASLYHLARQLARYGTVPLLLAPGPRRRRLAALGLALVAPAVTDFLRLRPRLRFPAFLGAHLLDELSYHAGALLGCLRQRTLRPLGVEIRLLSRR